MIGRLVAAASASGAATAAILNIPSNLGYAALGGLVLAESGGVPVPGETALIAAAVLAQQGKLSIALVIAIAATAAIAGDNIGYTIGRRIGRNLLTRPGRWHRQRLDALERGESFFARHGGKAVFLARWITGLRVWAAWIAGMTGMRWPTFFLWNALGGIAWATTVGLAGYLLGSTATKLIENFGLGAAIVAGLAVLSGLVVWHLRSQRGS